MSIEKKMYGAVGEAIDNIVRSEKDYPRTEVELYQGYRGFIGSCAGNVTCSTHVMAFLRALLSYSHHREEIGQEFFSFLDHLSDSQVKKVA